MPKIALIDCNNFFASCEVLKNPSLIGKPVCVLSNNEGCVVARSYEAKKLGVPMGIPYFMAKKQFPKCIYLKGNHPLYIDISKRVMEVVKTYSPKVEIYSIDEAFIDLENTEKANKGTAEEIIKKIKEDIKESVGIDVSIGLAPTKTLAKFASDKAKNTSNIFTDIHPKGLYVIKKENIIDELKSAKIEDIWGIGKRTEKKLKGYIIKTPYDFVKQNDSWIKGAMGIIGLNLKAELTGRIINPVLEENEPPKSIQKSESMKTPTNDKGILLSELYKNSHKMCKKLRSLGLKGEILSVYLKKKDFEIIGKKIILTSPQNSEFEINEHINQIFKEIYSPYSLYRATGIIISKLSKDNLHQLNMFELEKNQKQESLSLAWDKLEKKFGKNIIHLGKNGIAPDKNNEKDSKK